MILRVGEDEQTATTVSKDLYREWRERGERGEGGGREREGEREGERERERERERENERVREMESNK